MTRTKASSVFGPYGTRPTDLHGDWYRVSLHARLIGMELIALCKDPADLRLPVGADWRETLCAKMSVSGPDRRNAKVAMSKLEEAGFLFVRDGFACVSLVPLLAQSGSTSVPLRSHSGFTPDPNPNQVPETVQVDSSSRLTRKEVSERASAHAHEATPKTRADEESTLWRQPLGPVPPELRVDPPVAPKKLDWVCVHELFLEAVGKSEGQAPGDPRSSTIVATAARIESGSDDSLFAEVVRRILSDWQRDTKSVKYGLYNCAQFIGKYTKPVHAPAAKVRRPDIAPPPIGQEAPMTAAQRSEMAKRWDAMRAERLAQEAANA